MRRLPHLAFNVAVTISTLDYIEGFSSPWFSVRNRRIWPISVDVASKASTNDCVDEECCVMCSGSYRTCSEFDNMYSKVSTRHLQRQVNPTIHTSRRKFVQFAVASTVTSFSSSAYGEEYNPIGPNTASSVSANNNIIAVPTGSLAPFSSTRQYRTIMLSNGLQVVLVKDAQVQRSSVALTVDGAGQFADPEEIPGLAHLMEHIVLSSSRAKTKVIERKARKLWKHGVENNRFGRSISNEDDLSDEQDFEDWLSDNDGDSNAFTAPGFVCFHFNAPHETLPEGLERFAELFKLDTIDGTVSKPPVIPREVARVDSELDRTSDASRAFYFLKSQFDPIHPFARFAAGSKETLETQPTALGIDVASHLLRFFRDHYVASRATLVVVGSDDLRALDRWVSPFSSVMSQKSGLADVSFRINFPNFKLDMGSELTQSIILRSNDDSLVDENIQTLAIEWPLSLVYSNEPRIRQAPGQHIVTAPVVGFVVSQIISRRGPGSLRSILEKFNWVPRDSLTKGVPRISFPVDVNGFQVMRMELGLTLEGFAARSAVVAAVFESIRTSISIPFKLDLVKQYLSTAWIHGYLLTPRPPDAISLAVDALRYGVGGGTGIGVQGYWHLIPSPEDSESAEVVREVVTDTLKTMAREDNAIISFRASPKAIFSYSKGIVDQQISTSPLFSPWRREPITGARYLVESRINGGSSLFKSFAWFAANFDDEELTPPYLNPLIPTKLRPPRLVIRQSNPNWGRRLLYLEEANESGDPNRKSREGWKLTRAGVWNEYQTVPTDNSSKLNEGNLDSKWKLWQIPPTNNMIGLPLPVRPPEPSIEGVVIIQLLSSLPSSFTSRQLMLSNLWLLSFDDSILDLSELGASAGIAYETSFNPTGLRLSFRGISQSLPSYVRRFCRRLVQHHDKILSGSARISSSVYKKGMLDAGRSSKISRLKKENIPASSQQISEQDIGNQGRYFLSCTKTGILITQGDILPKEGNKLLDDVRYIFRECGKLANHFEVSPQLRDLLYVPYWRPRDSSPCLLPGVQLVSEACGRVPR